jgi:hypothetical protein
MATTMPPLLVLEVGVVHAVAALSLVALALLCALSFKSDDLAKLRDDYEREKEDHGRDKKRVRSALTALEHLLLGSKQPPRGGGRCVIAPAKLEELKRLDGDAATAAKRRAELAVRVHALAALADSASAWEDRSMRVVRALTDALDAEDDAFLADAAESAVGAVDLD